MEAEGARLQEGGFELKAERPCRGWRSGVGWSQGILPQMAWLLPADLITAVNLKLCSYLSPET